MKCQVQLSSSRELLLLTKIIEGAAHLAVVKTISGQAATAEILCTDDQWPEVQHLLQALQDMRTVAILSIIQ